MEAQTQTPAVQNEQQQSTGLQVAVTGFVDSVRTNLPIIQEKVGKAKAALSLIKQVTNPEEDLAAEKALARTRATFELCEGLRMEGTRMLDGIKSDYMSFEKQISPNVNDSAYCKIRDMRNAYAKSEHEKQQAAIAKANADRARREEIARLQFEYQTAFTLNSNALITQLRRSLDTFVSGLTLETFDTAEKRLSLKPNIKRETFESWFGIQTSLSPEDLAPIMAQIREQYTYERVNENYLKVAEPILQEYREKLPGVKKNLEELAALAEKDAAAAAALKQQQDEARAAELKGKEESDTAAAEAAKAEAERKANISKMDAAFGQQLVLQENAGVKGAKVKRAAVVDCPPQDLARVMAEVMYNCFLSPKFAGVFKLIKGTANRVEPDADGVPVYEKWAELLLTFFAEHCSAQVEGIKFVDRVSTVARADKN